MITQGYSTRQSLHVNVREFSNLTALHRYIDDARPTSMLLLGGDEPPNKVAWDLHNHLKAVGSEGAIYRPYDFGGAREGMIQKTRTVEQALGYLRGLNAGDMWINVGNEPVPQTEADAEQLSDWYADLLYKATAEGFKLVVPNFASGAFPLAHIHNGCYDSLIKALAETEQDFGTHSYAEACPPINTAGRDIRDLMNRDKVQPSGWPTRAEIFEAPPTDTDDNWLIGREHEFIERARAIYKDPTLTFPIAITECWFDSMGIPQAVKDFVDDRCGGPGKYRGTPTVRGYLAWAFPDWSFEQALCELWLWLENVHPAHYRVFCQFAWSENYLWSEGYGMQRVVPALEKWISYLPRIVREPSPMPDLPQPVWVKCTLVLPVGTTYVNIREDHDANSDDKGDAKAGEIYEVDAANIVGGEYTWNRVLIDGKVIRWIANLQPGAKFEDQWQPVEAPAPPEEPPTEPDDTEPLPGYSKVEIDEKLGALESKLDKQRIEFIAYFQKQFETMPDAIMVLMYEAFKDYLTRRGLLQIEAESKPDAVEAASETVETIEVQEKLAS